VSHAVIAPSFVVVGLGIRQAQALLVCSQCGSANVKVCRSSRRKRSAGIQGLRLGVVKTRADSDALREHAWKQATPNPARPWKCTMREEKEFSNKTSQNRTLGRSCSFLSRLL
jgi:hypothetical protein